MKKVVAALAFVLVAQSAAAITEHAKLLPPLPPLPEPEIEYAPAAAPLPQSEPELREPEMAVEEEEARNRIDWVMAVDYLTVELKLAEPLPAEELAPDAIELARTHFRFSDGVEAVSAPMPVEGETRMYRLRVDGLQPNTLYTVAYENSRALTFRTYATQEEMDERYKGRYGDHW